jgi:hypothetical protein
VWLRKCQEANLQLCIMHVACCSSNTPVWSRVLLYSYWSIRVVMEQNPEQDNFGVSGEVFKKLSDAWLDLASQEPLPDVSSHCPGRRLTAQWLGAHVQGDRIEYQPFFMKAGHTLFRIFSQRYRLDFIVRVLCSKCTTSIKLM